MKLITVELTPEESDLINRVLVAAMSEMKPTTNQSPVVRVACGWTRERLRELLYKFPTSVIESYEPKS